MTVLLHALAWAARWPTCTACRHRRAFWHTSPPLCLTCLANPTQTGDDPR